MKVPKKINTVISSVQKHKSVPGIIYNLPEDLRREIVLDQKQSIVIDAYEVNSRTAILNVVLTSLDIPSCTLAIAMLKIEQQIGKRNIIVDNAEFLASNAYEQVREFSKSRIPIILLSSHEGFGDRFRGSKFYRENNFFACDYKEVN